MEASSGLWELTHMMPRPRLVNKTCKMAADAAFFGHHLTVTLLDNIDYKSLTTHKVKTVNGRPEIATFSAVFGCSLTPNSLSVICTKAYS